MVYRMTRALLGSSPFLLGGTLNVHLEKYTQEYPRCVEELSKEAYVDDINISCDTVKEAQGTNERNSW